MITRNHASLLYGFALLNVVFSFNIGVFINMPQVLNQLFNESFTNHYGSPLSDVGISTITSACFSAQLLGEIVGIIALLPLLDSYGRKFCVVNLRVAIYGLTCVLELAAAFVPSFEIFVLTLFLNGLCFHFKYPASIIYLSECSPDNRRGLSAVVFSLSETASTIILLILAQPTVFGNYSVWYWLPVISLTISLFVGAMFWRLPESPRFLVDTGKYEEAAQAFKYFHGNLVDTEEQIKLARNEIHMEKFSKMSIRDVWKSYSLRKIFYLILAMMLAGQFSPVMMEMTFSIRIQNQMGLQIDQALFINTVSRALLLPLFFVTSALIDNLGRRPLLYSFYALGIVKGIMMAAGSWIVFESGTSLVTVIVALTNDALSLIMNCTAAYQILYLITAEIIPAPARVAITQASMLLTYLVSVPFSFLQPLLLNLFMPGIYLILLFAEILLCPYIVRNLPETKNRSIADVVDSFDYAVRSRVPTRCSIGSLTDRSHLLSSKRNSNYSSL